LDEIDDAATQLGIRNALKAFRGQRKPSDVARKSDT
jgi:hypothetical protein